MPSHRENWFEGWRLFAVLTLALIALSIWIAGMRQFEADGVRMVIRFTARTSLLFFALAFSAAALARPHLRRFACHPRRCDRLLCADGSCRLCGSDIGCLLHFRRHRLCLHH